MNTGRKVTPAIPNTDVRIGGGEPPYIELLRTYRRNTGRYTADTPIGPGNRSFAPRHSQSKTPSLPDTAIHSAVVRVRVDTRKV